MGSGISRIEQRQPAAVAQAMHRPRFTLASLLCGTSFDDDPPPLEDQLNESSSTITEYPARISDFHRNNDPRCMMMSPSTFFTENVGSSQASPQSHDGYHTEVSVENIETGLPGKGLLKSNAGGLTEQASSSSKSMSCNSPLIGGDATFSSATGECSTNGSDYQDNIGRTAVNNTSLLEIESLPENRALAGNRVDEVPATCSSTGSSSSLSADQSAVQLILEEESDEAVASPDSGFFILPRARQHRSGSVLHVDIISISSNMLTETSGDTENREASRNRRQLLDSFTRLNSDRDDSSPSVLLPEDSDDLTSQERLLLNMTSDFFANDGDASEYHSRHGVVGRRRLSRSEVRGLHGRLDEHSESHNLCASGLHPDGTCSCEAFLLTEGSGTRASISQILMLAEALFEVLDEIHQQPVPMSLSVVSCPAPQPVVDSFPLKTHSKSNVAESGDTEQCYICLDEYIEGDRIRVLPCRHEYHMSCVDKWLKEIHGVCPLCRGDVCNGSSASTSNSS